MRTITVKHGAIFPFHAIRWNDGFGFLTALIDPVMRVYEDGRSLDDCFMDFFNELSSNTELADENYRPWQHLPGGPLAYLKRKADQPGVEHMREGIELSCGIQP